MDIIEIRVTLDDVVPAVIRILQVPADLPLDRLHLTLQAAMGWTNTHLYMFRAGHATWGVPDPEFDDTTLAADKTSLAKVISEAGASAITYIYDFGDSWEHRIDIISRTKAEPGETIPRLTGINGTCPPEDVGGPPGYAEFLAAKADKKHPDHKHYTQWHAGKFDPNAPPADTYRHAVLTLAQRWMPKTKPNQTKLS